MITGRIKTLDVANRRAVLATEDGREITLTFPEGATIEVAEAETMGTVGGELADLREGYYVEVELGEHGADGSCACTSLVCVS
ncbi:MAG: hypothetical protein KatS3mg131_0555 [Candidatus Tectimicrobiota bacterium]|nr:MAG: hypothetical protein KatS3mg131_0555 [Candidatus Tectomicrobia bacterium]